SPVCCGRRSHSGRLTRAATCSDRPPVRLPRRGSRGSRSRLPEKAFVSDQPVDDPVDRNVALGREVARSLYLLELDDVLTNREPFDLPNPDIRERREQGSVPRSDRLVAAREHLAATR